MKKLLFFLIIPVSGFGQYVDFDSIEHYYDIKKILDRAEMENRVECTKDNGETYYPRWGNDCDSSFMSPGKTRYIHYLITNLDKRDIQGFAYFVSKKMIEHYLEYSRRYNVFNNTITLWGVSDLKIEFVTGDTGRMIAQAHSPLEGDNTIIVNVDKWEGLNNYQRVWLMMHEWGHEAFGMKHGDNKLMYPLMPKEELLKTAEVNNKVLDKIEERVFEEGLNQGLTYDRANSRARRAVNRYIAEVWDEEKEQFGGSIIEDTNYTSLIDSDMSEVCIAFNTFFDAAVDFFDYLVKNHRSKEYEWDIKINGKTDSSLPKAKELVIFTVKK